jgi:starch-binding outer membrane protein, SusD/RagB family
MKRIYYILLLSLAIIAYSCKDLLIQSPQDQISDPEFWNTESDLQLYINGLYSTLYGWNPEGAGGTALPDATTDVTVGANNFLSLKTWIDGELTVPGSGGGWDWTNVRNVNYFLDNANRVLLNTTTKKQYIGEGFFFRAWFYYNLLRQFGDLPIITHALTSTDKTDLYGSRSSRTDVVNFMMNDLDSAILYMGNKAAAGIGRLNKDVAALLKARVCLYEGTWEKYHQNDVFKGKGNGSAFLSAAEDAAKTVMNNGNYSLSTGNTTQVYYQLFNQENYSSNPEVLLWRQYDHNKFSADVFGNQMWNWPQGCGITLGMMRTYLCSDGLPVSVSPLYQGDTDIRQAVVNRDPRCIQTVMNPGDPIAINLKGDTTKYTTPTLTTQNSCPTGYESQKFRRPQLDPLTGNYSESMGYIFFRYAEALLIYAEARAELGELTQADADLTVNKLRDRVGMPHLILNAIVTDPNWPDYGYTVPDYLQEIRRERIVELLNEGFRFDDLLRWRADKLIVGQRPKGAYYTAELKAVNSKLAVDSNNDLDPLVGLLVGPNGGFNFKPQRDYLKPLPINDLTLNTNLVQNPGW